MASKRQKNTGSGKITRMDRRFDLNIGTILFGLILVYLIIIFVVYLARDKVTSYEVVRGALSGNYRYRALALKTEEVVQAQEAGPIRYYAREGVNVGSGELICSVGGSASAGAASARNLQTTLSDQDQSDIKSMLTTYAASSDPVSFQALYDLKSSLESVVLQSSIDEDPGQYVSGSYQAPDAGFVVYSVDGLENLEESQLTQTLFRERAYKKENLRLNQSVSSGDPVYKLVTSEDWQLYFPVDDKLRTQLNSKTSIKVRFLKDNSVFTAPFTIMTGKDGYYGKISLSNSLVRFAADRYLDIELVLSKASGLKIPVSSIVSRNFYRIPADYVTVSQKSEKEVYLKILSFRKDGSESARGLTAQVYAKDSETDSYLVDASLFADGDYVEMPGTDKRFQISQDSLDTIQGVYNINKGYAVFRQVNIVDQNEEFCIVDPNSIYGLAAHDRIALNASQVKEDEIIA